MNPAQTANAIYRHIPAICFAIAGAIYFSTLAPTFLHTDSGELAAVQYTFGIAHPTGYPLFTLLGWLFTRITVTEPVVQLNFLCLLFTAGGLFFFARTLREFVDKFRPKGQDDLPDNWLLGNFFTVFAGTMFLAFSKTFWAQSTSVEVYSLHILLISLVMFLVIKAEFAPKANEKSWLWVAGAVGLSFTNHMTSLLLVPGIAYLFIRKYGIRSLPWQLLLKMAGIFFGVLVLLYALLPLRASANPQFNWGDPDTFEKFWHHFTGKQFQVWMFSGKEAASQNLKEFFTGTEDGRMLGLGREFMWIPLAFAAVGLRYLFTLRKSLAWFSVISLVFGIGYVINYSIKDLDTYYLFVYLVLAFLAGLGLRFVWVRVKGSPMIKWATSGIAVVAIGLQVVFNYARVDESENFLFRDYTVHALEKLPANAVVVTHQWDFLVSPQWYLSVAEDFRPDVVILEYEMLRARHWYYEHMEANFPDVATALGAPLQTFADEVEKFDLGKPHDVNILSQSFNQVWANIFQLSKERPVYIAPEMLYQTMQRDRLGIPVTFSLVPEEYFYRVIPKAQEMDYHPLEQHAMSIRFPEKENYYTQTIRHQVAVLAADRARYELNFKNFDQVKSWVTRVRQVNPKFQLPPELLGY